jgi:hypothetical protein
VKQAPGELSATVTLRELIAGNLRRLRTDVHASPEDVVKASIYFGLAWTASWLQSVERGTKAITADELLALPVVLTTALGHRVGLADLLLGEAQVRLGKADNAGEVSSAYLREVITASPYRRSFTGPAFTAPAEPGALPAEERVLSPSAQAAEKMRIITSANLGNVDIRALGRAEAGAGDAETKLARRLGVAGIVVIAAAADLWGRSFTEERDAALQPPEGEAPTSPTTVTKRLSAALTSRIADAAAAAAMAAAAAANDVDRQQGAPIR